ncbi:MAG: ABC transporter permease [Bacteroidetes bacterium]|nr:ABC transporter permease [Bacteroidota bacterium]
MNGKEWTLVIRPQSAWWDINWKDIWKSRNLLQMFVWRDFVSVYKQTILGPLWFFIQPVVATIIFTVIFGRIAKIPTDGVPPLLFYLSGLIGWNYFADCLTKTSTTFTANANIFGKVYFPRLIVPLSIVISNMVKFSVQFCLFLGFLIFYYFNGTDIHPNYYIFLVPVLIILMAGLGLGFGIIISSLTTKYRDLQNLVGFGTQLLMYLTPVVYPLSFVTGTYRWLLLANPMTAIIEAFKYAFLGVGEINFFHLAYSGIFMVFVLITGILIFNKIEKSFMDTV